MFLRTALIVLLSGVFIFAAAAEQPSASSPIIYPKENSIVGSRVNLVLDPTEVPFFQVLVGKTEYPMIDTSTGRHASQGLELEPGVNTITVKVFAQPPADGKNGENKDQGAAAKKDGGNGNKQDKDAIRESLILVSTWKRQVFSKVDLITGKAPADFKQEPFHSSEHETSCSGCHNLDAPPRNAGAPKKPEDMICYVCHRKIPTGKNIHGPAAVWNCLGCHNPDLYPVKYAFSSADPWKVIKTTHTVEPMVFTLSTAELFKPASVVLLSKDKAKDALRDVVSYIRQNPADKIRLEVHSDNTPLKPQKTKKGKAIGFSSNQALTAARAQALTGLLREAGVPVKKLLSVGMGDKLPKAPNKTKEGRELNNRVEIVVSPADIKIINSQKLPVLKDRVRVVVNLSYSQGQQVKKLRIVEKLPKGLRYLKGSGFLGNRPAEPKINGNELAWDLGDMDTNFAENVSYVVKKGKGAAAVPETVNVAFISDGRSQTRAFDPKAPAKKSYTVKDACFKCHEGIANKKFKHGPVDAGYCNLCHDPHASPNPAWLRKPAWELCTTCHADQGSGVHVVAGVVYGNSHPTKSKRDPARPGKRLTCSSCHDPHSSENEQLFAYDVNSRAELCTICHAKK